MDVAIVGIGIHHFGSGSGKLAGNFSTDACSSTGDQGDLILHIQSEVYF